ncbi:alanine--tRNA ligase [Candidatus Micrarchaeota archaeon]|nr:alanine--tRNA ligase [Candidatus Micrarchaeota archaeon]
MLSKKKLKQTFANDYNTYYKVPLFENEGFERHTCKECGKGFWSATPRDTCGDSVHEPYSFFRKEKREETYSSFWKKFAEFWQDNGHEVIPRYPVLSRWREDLPFTIASIVDFQRLEQGKVVFEYPANPLMVPQMCLRFPDLANIGITGRHFSCFMMAGQHSFNHPKEGYWKDECLQYNFDFLTKVLKVPKSELVYGEDVWNMPDFSAFGPSMESFSRGLELVNSVFMQYRAAGQGFEELDMKVIDVGWGFERLLWFYNGTSTAYDAVFPKPLALMRRKSGFSEDAELMERYAALSASLDVDSVVNMKQEKMKIAEMMNLSLEEMEKTIAPMQAMYAIADHSRAILFALADGALPSNVSGGYNLRVLLRRAFAFLKEYDFDFELEQIISIHADDLKGIFPELRENIDNVNAVVAAERRKHEQSVKKATSLAREVLLKKEPVTLEKMVTLYESHGVTPELLERVGVKEVPTEFYQRLTEGHVMEKSEPGEKKAKKTIDLPPLEPTEQLYYLEQGTKHAKAKVLHVEPALKILVFDRTIFYPEGGGQHADLGMIENVPVSDVQKQGEVVLHYMEDVSEFRKGSEVLMQLDWAARESISRHHTATHIMIATARKVLGNHVWQHGSSKTPDEAHVDVTHFEKPSREQIKEMEKTANEVVREARPVYLKDLDRGEAEKEYGFRLYQGGCAIGKRLRVLEVKDWDVEACGGLHVGNTSEVGFIKITGVENIQDGVIRLRYKAGPKAIEQIQKDEDILNEACGILSVSKEQLPQSVKRIFEEWKQAKKDLEKLQGNAAEAYAQKLVGEALKMKKTTIAHEVPFDAKGLEILASTIAKTLDCVLWNKEGAIVAATTEKSKQNAVDLLKGAGAKGGGSPKFARGKKG